MKIFKKQNMNQFSQLCSMFTCWPLEAKLVQKKTAFNKHTIIVFYRQSSEN